MESPEKIEIEVLKEIVIKGYEKEFDIVLTQVKQTHKGETLYKIFSELKYDGKLFDIIGSLVTYTRKTADYYFFKLEEDSIEDREKRKIS